MIKNRLIVFSLEQQVPSFEALTVFFAIFTHRIYIIPLYTKNPNGFHPSIMLLGFNHSDFNLTILITHETFIVSN